MSRSRLRKVGFTAALFTGSVLLVATWAVPASADGGGTNGGVFKFVGASYSQELRFASCMRRHDEPSFPDPSSNGVFTVKGIDLNSPEYAAGAEGLPVSASQGAPAVCGGAGQSPRTGAQVRAVHAFPRRAQLPRPAGRRRWNQFQFGGRRRQLTAAPAGATGLREAVPVPGRRVASRDMTAMSQVNKKSVQRQPGTQVRSVETRLIGPTYTSRLYIGGRKRRGGRYSGSNRLPCEIPSRQLQASCIFRRGLRPLPAVSDAPASPGGLG